MGFCNVQSYAEKLTLCWSQLLRQLVNGLHTVKTSSYSISYSKLLNVYTQLAKAKSSVISQFPNYYSQVFKISFYAVKILIGNGFRFWILDYLAISDFHTVRKWNGRNIHGPFTCLRQNNLNTFFRIQTLIL